MIRVLLVEDTKMGRDCITGYIRSSDRYELADTITNAGMAEMTCMHTPVDLILMDYRTENNEDGIEAAAVIKRHFPKIKIIIVTSMTSVDLIDRAREAGADSFWYKEAGDAELLEVLRLVVDGYTNPAIAEKLHISVDNVKWHLKELYQKTGYTDRVGLVGAVIDKAFIVPGL